MAETLSATDIAVGDKVQIRAGGIDVTNGGKAKAGKMYGEGGPLWAEVTAIVEGWKTGSKFGLPATVTKVRCSNKGVVVWQVRPEDIYPQVVKTAEPTPEPEPAPPPEPDPTPVAIAALTDGIRDNDKGFDFTSGEFEEVPFPFVSGSDSGAWYNGAKSLVDIDELTGINRFKEIGKPSLSKSMFHGNAHMQTPAYRAIDVSPKGKERAVPKSVKVQGITRQARYATSWESEGRRRELLNQVPSLIQNESGFPLHVGPVQDELIDEYGDRYEHMLVDKYDYQFIPGDTRYSVDGKTDPIRLEERLKNIRASLGIPVHGNNDIARSVKYYMYNRFKVPDTDLAHNRTVTHVFFTRPDLNLLTGTPNDLKANAQAMNHTDTALIWRRNPELFKLLTDYARCGDHDNFNMLLSNQVSSFSLIDESLSTVRAGRSWAEHEMSYAQQYTGRTAGEFSCTFNETSEYSIINLIKLWMTYIDNVSRGAWSPNYDRSKFQYCHALHRAIDYAASVYVFKCGPDGEDVLYWSKYYGVFPIVSGASALSWESTAPISDAPKPNISFAYSYKRDLSPISLLEFNHVAAVGNNGASWIPAFDENLGHTSRPFVGSPYIELSLGGTNTNVLNNDVRRAIQRAQIRLKFRKDDSTRRTDDILFKANIGKG